MSKKTNLDPAAMTPDEIAGALKDARRDGRRDVLRQLGVGKGERKATVKAIRAGELTLTPKQAPTPPPATAAAPSPPAPTAFETWQALRTRGQTARAAHYYLENRKAIAASAPPAAPAREE